MKLLANKVHIQGMKVLLADKVHKQEPQRSGGSRGGSQDASEPPFTR